MVEEYKIKLTKQAIKDKEKIIIIVSMWTHYEF